MTVRNTRGKFVKQPVEPVVNIPKYVDATPAGNGVVFTYSEALMLMKKGFHMARSGWNGKGMRVFYVNQSPINIPANLPAVDPRGAVLDPYIAMYTAQGTIVPWLCSNGDMAANDWTMVALPVGMSL